MGAPTWPPTPEDAEKATLEEYGDQARAVIDSDEEAERALLARFLFAPPPRQLVAGEENGTPLDEILRSLTAWARMVTGLEFTVAYSDPAATDGRNLFLPRAVPAPRHHDDDACLYRAMALVQLGMIRFGMLSNRRFIAEIHTDWVLRSTYHLLASRYVVRQWSAQWPGIRRDFERIRCMEKAGMMRVNVTQVPREGMPPGFLPLYTGLTDLSETTDGDGEAAHSAIRAIDAIDDPRAAVPIIVGQSQVLREEFKRLRLGPPPLPYFIGIIRPEWHLEDLTGEMAASQEWRKGNKPLRQLMERVRKSSGRTERLDQAVRKRIRPPKGPALPELTSADSHVPPPISEEGWRYDEWDDRLGLYRAGAIRVFEIDAHSGPLDSYARIRDAHHREIREIRRRFEALRLQERWLHGQPDGTEIDINRAIAAFADIRAGHTPRADWYMRFQRRRESVAVMTMVDLSGSTQGHVIHLEQDAIVLFAAGLEVLAFPHAFFGFSGEGAQRCHIHRIKDWDDPYSEAVIKRLGNLQPGGSTRLGAFVRHGTAMLSRRPEGRRILLLLSDGKPEDRDEYRGRHGIRDTAMAVREAVAAGVFVFCISLDRGDDAPAYLQEIFGRGRFLRMEQVDALPTRLPEVFRTLIR